MNNHWMLRMVRGAVAMSVFSLVACGGGGSDGIPDTAIVIMPSGPLASIAGRYSISPGSQNGELLVLQDGHASGYFVSGQLASPPVTATNFFDGTFVATASGASSIGARWHFQDATSPSATGKADVTLASANSNLTVAVANATAPIVFASPQTYPKVTVSPALAGVPFAKLTGRYFDSESIPPTGLELQVTEGGTMSGLYGFNCQMTGTLGSYDPTTTLFRMNATFAGVGCAARRVTEGSGQFTGSLDSSRFGHIRLRGFGLIGDRMSFLTGFMHSQQLGTY